MIIGSSTTTAAVDYGTMIKSRGLLEVQLEKYKVALADWVNCPACNTPEGKAKIAQLSSVIADIETELKTADTATRSGITAVQGVNSSAGVKEVLTPDANRSVPPLSDGLIGSRLNVYG